MAKTKKIPLITDFNHIPAEALVPKEEQPYPVPGHWKWVRLGTTVKNITAKTESFDAVDKYLGLEDLNAGGGILRISDTHDIKSAKTVFQYGDVLYGKLRPYLNKHAVVNFSGVCSTDILALRPEKVIDATYLDFWLSTPFFVNAAITNSKGVNLPRVSFNSIAQYPFPLPPLEEQKQIVAYLGEKLGKIDSVREKLQDFLDHADKRKDNLIQAGVTGHLTSHWREDHLSEASQDIELPEGSLVPKEEQPYPLPAHWKWVWLGSVVKFQGGGTPDKTKPTFWNGDIPWASVKDLSTPVIVETQDHISKQGLSNSSANLCSPGDLLLATRIDPGRVSISQATIAINQDLKIVKSEVASVPYLYFWFKGAKNWFHTNSSGTTVKGVTITKLNAMPSLLPPLEEQEEIARILDEQLERIERTDKLVAEVLKRLDIMKQQIVSAALAGRLSLQIS
ncbi:restriction endonuclease subunit S [Varibaculum massiliense]|uniref:restriction endonuclease subunit S n=1 Tax=Varibaculum massiliense TaxID=1852372 RepID=UPI002889F7F8|nr:restriction endonuclease subunit S [Varibaculum massiliense]